MVTVVVTVLSRVRVIVLAVFIVIAMDYINMLRVDIQSEIVQIFRMLIEIGMRLGSNHQIEWVHRVFIAMFIVCDRESEK